MDSQKLPHREAYSFSFEGKEAETVAAAFTERLNNCLADPEDSPTELDIEIANWDLNSEEAIYVAVIEDPADFIDVLNGFRDNAEEAAATIVRESEDPRFSNTTPAERLLLGSYVVDIVTQITEKVAKSEVRREFSWPTTKEPSKTKPSNRSQGINKDSSKLKTAKKN